MPKIKQKKHGYYTFTIIKPWLIFIRDMAKTLLQIDIQCPPLILAPLVNMSKGSCENKSALFILFIFYSKIHKIPTYH